MNLTSLIEKSISMSDRFRAKAGESAFRASEVGYFCARKHALKKVYPGIGESAPTIASALPLALGTGIHWAFQNELLSEVLVGEWRCNGCGRIHGKDRYINKPKECDFAVGFAPISFNEYDFTILDHKAEVTKCGSTDFEYVEKGFVSDDGLISGHPDGFVRSDEGELILIELKTIGLGPHKTLAKGPLEPHIKQAQIYMHYTGCKRCFILYIIKHERGTRALVEFELQYDSDLVNQMLDMMKKADEFKKGDKLPERVCKTEKCSLATYCSYSRRCFQIGN